MMNGKQIRMALKEKADEKYRKFSSGLLPGTESILGVRLPALRSLAKKLARQDWRKTLNQIADDSFEEIMLQGMMIGYVDCPTDERLKLIRHFVPKIDNWSVCDSFCSGLKFVKDEQERVWRFLQPYLTSELEFEQRFGAVMLLDYYIDDEWLDRTLSALEQLSAEKYYAQMAVAWAMAECYLRFPERVWPVLKEARLAPEIQQKALQKIIESRKISPDMRAAIRALKKKQREQNGRG
jgi:3-methyladenine DNA glycosylase AlkD